MTNIWRVMWVVNWLGNGCFGNWIHILPFSGWAYSDWPMKWYEMNIPSGNQTSQWKIIHVWLNFPCSSGISDGQVSKMGEGGLAMVNSLLLDRSKWFFPSRNHGFSHKRWGGSSNSSLKLRWTMEISATSSVFYRFQPAHEAWQNRPGPLLLLPFWCYAVCGSTSRGDGGSSESTCGWSLNWMTQGFVCGLGCQHIVYNYVL